MHDINTDNDPYLYAIKTQKKLVEQCRSAAERIEFDPDAIIRLCNVALTALETLANHHRETIENRIKTVSKTINDRE